MSKKVLLSTIAILFVMIGIPQGVMGQNKVKKVKYMNYKYHGEVNDEKIPDGEGEISLLDIKGHFNGNIVNNATIDAGKIKYSGDLSFDDLSNVTLKAGGIITIYYCSDWYDISWTNEAADGYGKNSYSLKLNKDSIVTAQDFNCKEQTIYIDAKCNAPDYLNPPTIKTPKLLREKEYKYYQGSFQLSKSVYVLDKTKVGQIVGYKDDKGRIWDFYYNTSDVIYKVTFPDGSYASNSTNGKIFNPNQTYFLDRRDWQIVNPEYTMKGIGENVKIIFKGENYHIILYDNGGLAGEDLINGKKDKLYIYGSKWENSKNIGLFGTESLPLQDIYNIIKEKLLPLVYVDNDNYLSVYNGSIDNYIGSLSKSGFKTKAQMNQMDKDEKQAKRQALNKKYGKVYVDAINNNKLMVGMPIKLLINDASWVNVYKMYMYNEGESGQFKVDILVEGKASNGWSSGTGVYHRTYRVWVKNWKITQFRNWTNNDEREFNRL